MKRLWKRFGVFLFMTVISAVFALALCGRPAQAKAVKLNKKKVYMLPGDTLKLKVTGTKKKVKWKSSNKKVVSVSKKGKLKAKKPGKATITARVRGKKLKCKVIVERTTARAKKLRSYILTNGKYAKSDQSYNLIWEPKDSHYNCYKVRLTAWKSNNNLEFYFDKQADSPESITSVIIKINLISGTSAVRKGSLYSNYYYMDVWEDDTVYGEITTNYDGKGGGLTLTRTTWIEENYPDPDFYDVTDSSVLNLKKGLVVNRLKDARVYWNKFFAQKATLKKYGISMNTIGFRKW